MRGAVLGKVIASKAPSLPVGSYVTCISGWTELAIVNAKDATLLEVPPNGKPTDAMGVLGMTGMTAYFGIIDIGQVKAGDFVVVSGAAGATGSVVCQIAKLKGAKVLGIAGSDDKVQWLKELGCDDALNYKDSEFAKNFKAATKDLIDVFFDNVGGDVLELALSRAKPHSRFVMCGGKHCVVVSYQFSITDNAQLSASTTPPHPWVQRSAQSPILPAPKADILLELLNDHRDENQAARLHRFRLR